jgi:Fic family protein
MGYLHEAFWLSEGLGQTRMERRSGAYRYFVPTMLADLEIRLDSDAAADIGRAERALLEVSLRPGPLQEVDGLSRFLLRAEAISSSFIEGLRLGSKRLMQAELNENTPTAPFKADVVATEIVGNIKALRDALSRADVKMDLDVQDLLDIHKALLKHTPLEHYAGLIRETQNWIGGNSYNPLNALHVPPAPEFLDELLDDLITFCNRTDVSPVQQAALAHTQFELIHPFVDGNGRTGRALIQLLLRRRGLIASAVPPISLILATHSKSYLAGLNSLCFSEKQPDTQAMEAIGEWLSFFAGCCMRACNEVHGFSDKAETMESRWRKELGSVRKGSALDKLLAVLVGMPVFTVQSASAHLGQSYQSVNLAVERLVEARVAKPLSAARRNRAYEVPDALDAFRAFERQLASPEGDTRIGKPIRPVPYRRN